MSKIIKIEDYISQRKKEDNLNEFDISARADNMNFTER